MLNLIKFRKELIQTFVLKLDYLSGSSHLVRFLGKEIFQKEVQQKRFLSIYNIVQFTHTKYLELKIEKPLFLLTTQYDNLPFQLLSDKIS
ncbi:unnamed protein product [Paramecium sonneborni]|uniref:Uncharacterized protein n=1 Tax=Paramecium sonneborni TaxID=65129 RepID=A0A8S1RVZ6_9CILI|nr:unnamed protein product [Paramecium sonneborni]